VIARQAIRLGELQWCKYYEILANVGILDGVEVTTSTRSVITCTQCGRSWFAVLAWQLALGFLITWLERWSLGEGVFFTFVTGVTIGYGGLVPHQPLSRFLAILIGFFGTIIDCLVAAIAVRALQNATDDLS
jgi:hypothetical protein